LRDDWQDARQLSQLSRLSEREVYEHLKHLELGARGSEERLRVQPSECLGCGFVFDERGRLTPPSRCPKCKSERISAPSFRLEAK
jgi:predicted Zn-ribbon and HTH transcriptional regulator